VEPIRQLGGLLVAGFHVEPDHQFGRLFLIWFHVEQDLGMAVFYWLGPRGTGRQGQPNHWSYPHSYPQPLAGVS
jgi:hypothetical protein